MFPYLLLLRIIPIDCKIIIFSLYLLVYFLKGYHNYFLACIQLLIIRKAVSQYASCSLIFSPVRSIINGEHYEKYLYNQSSHYEKYGMSDCFCAFINLKVDVSLNHGVSLHFVLLPVLWTCWSTFQAKNNVRSTSVSSSLTLVSHRSHNLCTVNCHLRGSGERNGTQRKTKLSFGRTMMQTLELLLLAKRHVSTQSLER